MPQPDHDRAESETAIENGRAFEDLVCGEPDGLTILRRVAEDAKRYLNDLDADTEAASRRFSRIIEDTSR